MISLIFITVGCLAFLMKIMIQDFRYPILCYFGPNGIKQESAINL